MDDEPISILDTERKRRRAGNSSTTDASRMRRYDALQQARAGYSESEIVEILGISPHTWNAWRYRYPDWWDEIQSIFTTVTSHHRLYDGSFVSFRKHYLDTDTPSYQATVARKIEEADEGEVTMLLMPPEHGKTTLLEDWCTYKLATEPQFRITVASASVEHPKKVLARVRNRLEADGPFPELVEHFGPFAPDHARSAQVWGQMYFNVAKRKTFDERDYSMRAIGITGSVQGTRCDLLLIDDVQSLRDIDQTIKRFEILRQDFLSRPSVFGRTVIIGTRVDEFDIYRTLRDKDVVDHAFAIPAYNVAESPHWPAPTTRPQRDDPETLPPEGVKFLWGDRYTPFQYATLRYRIGETAWARNYMQHPEAAARATFDEKTTEATHDEARSVVADPRRLATGDMVPVVVGVDPAIGGGNGVVSAAMRPERFEVLNCRLDYELTKYSQIIDIIEEECVRFNTPTSYVSTVVVEDKAFQRGLLRDDRMVEVAERYGFRIVPNTTGKEKADPDIGIPSMPLLMQRNQITLPWADEVSQEAMQPLLGHLHQWRPNVDPAKLPQDLVMALWFAVRQWRAVRNLPAHPGLDANQFRSEISPMRSQARRRARRPNRAYRYPSTYRDLR